MPELKTTTAIILAGGFGTRLQSVVSDVPKPMAPVNGKPFLAILIENVVEKGIQQVVLAVGYKYEVIQEYFGKEYKGCVIKYVIESSPLGTGGAIKQALEFVEEKSAFVLNGDTLFDVDLFLAEKKFEESEADLILNLKPIAQQDRYGTVTLEGDRVVGFAEKTYIEKGDINGGVYLVRTNIFYGIELAEVFSFETDFMPNVLNIKRIIGFRQDKFFIDIGIPEDYFFFQQLKAEENKDQLSQ